VLTRNGWLLAALGAVLLMVARLLGIWELSVVGLAALALVIVAALSVGLSRLKVNISRQIHPVRLHAGQPARVDMGIRSLGRRSPVMRLRDPVAGTNGADITLGPLAANQSVSAAYRLPTDRRGALRVGPMTVEVTDPFGLARISAQAASVADITIFPELLDIVAAPFTVGHDPHGGAQAPMSTTRSGDDFYALRQYTVGDDLRRVHWRSTARRDELMVRQHELPWQGRVTVLLDTRHEGADGKAFEVAVSGAASVLAASTKRRDVTRLVTTDGGDSDFATGNPHLDALLEFLATVHVSSRGGIQLAVSKLLQHSVGGALVAFTVSPTRQDIEALMRLRQSYGSVTIVNVGSSETNRDKGPAVAVNRTAPGTTVLSVPDAHTANLTTAWNLAHRRRGSMIRTGH